MNYIQKFRQAEMKTPETFLRYYRLLKN